ncbi:calcium-binding protein E63-1 [Galendromus occidentalis]|uniref:Calcium-binding protein E63-1 n=1 Tax=Galendromus occidentalis TaxID=34638 RepID=A0AAJ7L2M1_9ACAR|nr:calcium-binding protein E63-1 [Galendromus occidentalis]
MCEATIVLPRPKRRSSVQVEKNIAEKVCLTIAHDEDGVPTSQSKKEKPPPETGRLQRLKELHMAFNMLDANNDGRVSLEEISVMLTKMGFDIPREALDLLMQDKSSTSSDQVSLSEFEFLQWIDDYLMKDDSGNPEDADQDMIAAFRIFDSDGDGYITRTELRRAMETIGEKISEKELDEILLHTDIDRDGRINYQGK